MSKEVKKCVCLPRFTQDVIDSFVRLEIASSASKSHYVNHAPEVAVRRIGSLLGSANKTNSADKENISEQIKNRKNASRSSVGCGKPPLAPVKAFIPFGNNVGVLQPLNISNVSM